jgi:hypothetical protein
MSQMTIALNNSIILFLLIMCAHVIISKSIAQQRPEAPARRETYQQQGHEQAEAPTGSGYQDAPGAPVPVDTPSPSCAAVQQVDCPAASAMPVLKNDEDDLYKYVFGEPLPSGKEPGSLQETDISSNTSSNTSRAASTQKSTQKAGGDACSGLGSNDSPKPYGSSTFSKSDGSGRLIIGSYKNEPALNGGEMFNGLTGYDGQTSSFEELA